ncbi:calcium-binding protein [Azospirillum sp.]|uniref:calcium-binding protein n=1 Tax=Azospirillum sp. TaxID=34012 RepID=UPI002D446C79|nr:calcium-binding protein [Azospirillum sp.]HYD68997.1 calcium-binding protein [Azospirillum sp.]
MFVNGTSGNDANLTGSYESDYINGHEGADKLSGLGGLDMLIGGTGNDTIDGGSGYDTTSYTYATKNVMVNLTTGTAVQSGVWGDTDQLISVENVIGSAQNDTLAGNQAINELFGGKGHDVLEGLGGDDKLSGGEGFDEATYAASAQGIIIDLATGTGQGGDAEGDTLFSIEKVTGSSQMDWLKGGSGNDFLAGGNGADVLWGRAGHDTMFGGAGNDTMEGNGGGDVMNGGAGADIFVLYQAAESTPDAFDWISDFSQAQGDKISLNTIDARAHTSGNQDFSFIGQSGFTSEGQLRYHHENGKTIVEANLVDYSDGAEMKIVLNGTINLTANDFFL